MRKIYVFGNPDIRNDSLPKKLLPQLAEKFPEIKFVDADPQDLDFSEDDLVIIDTVLGIEEVTVFDNLENFEKKSRISLHDHDLGMELFLQKKMGKIKNLKIIGIPPNFAQRKAFLQVCKNLKKLASFLFLIFLLCYS